MSRIVIMLFLTLLFAGQAFSQVPPEVLEPYKKYQAASKQNDHELASEHALDAWKQAEKRLGDHKTTGDLAFIFASIPTRMFIGRISKDKVKAYKRAIELSTFYPTDPYIIELQRRLDYAEYMQNEVHARKVKGRIGSLDHMKKISEIIEHYDMEGSTFHADNLVLIGHFHLRNGDPETAIEHLTEAERIYESPGHKYTSKFRHFVPIYKGDSYDYLSESDDTSENKINAALEYQEVMQNLEGLLPAEHPLIKQAFSRWISTRYDIEEIGELEKAEAAGLCECWPFENYKNQAKPLLSVPPLMPRQAERSGHVVVQYDLDGSGSPVNISVASSTEKLFEKAAIESVQSWKYHVSEETDPSKSRTGITSTVRFKLYDRAGKLIPEKR